MKTLLILLMATLMVRGAEDVLTWNFTMDSGGQVEIETFKGVIDVTTHASPDISIQARIRPDGEDCDPTTVEVFARERGGDVNIWIEHHPKDDDGFMGVFKSRSYTAPFVDFTIVMPEEADLEIDDHKSQYKIEAPLGAVDVTTHKGRGAFFNVRGDFDLDTHKGEFDIQVTRLQELEIDTYKGDIAIAIDRAEDFEIRAETYKGDFTFRGRSVEIVNEDDREKSVDYREGSGRNSIRLETYKGHIQVEFRD